MSAPAVTGPGTDDGVLTLTADEVMARWRPGSADTRPDGTPWTWGDEIVDLALHDAEALDRIATRYMHLPILAGSDGRIWDGHHRVVVAARTGQPLRVTVAPARGET